MNSMKAIILAAGSGTRLEKYTKKLPKALVDVNGRSIIERQISLLQKISQCFRLARILTIFPRFFLTTLPLNLIVLVLRLSILTSNGLAFLKKSRKSFRKFSESVWGLTKSAKRKLDKLMQLCAVSIRWKKLQKTKAVAQARCSGLGWVLVLVLVLVFVLVLVVVAVVDAVTILVDAIARGIQRAWVDIL